jgi:NAD(P)-dependent dehydrogenase (short-subunit alcohol dehydrogenase family)
VSPNSFIPGRFTGKVLLITGAAIGTVAQGVTDPAYRMSIGAATAIRAAREGALVACADLKADGLAVMMDLIAADGGTAVAIAADVTSSEDTDRAVGQVEAGRLDEPALGADALEEQNEL